MLKQTIKIKSYEVMPNGNVKISALMKHMQQLAQDDSDQYGATYDSMREDDIVFVIVKFGIVFHKNIKKDDEIEILTINERITGAVFVRDFVIYKAGLPVAEASTQWVLMSYSRRFPVRPSSLKTPIAELKLNLASVELPRKACETETFTSESVHTVRFSELDENNHMNNTVYADLIFDYINCDKNKDIESCYINFSNEALLDDNLLISSNEDSRKYMVRCINSNKNNVCFEANVTFR